MKKEKEEKTERENPHQQEWKSVTEFKVVATI